MSRWGPIGLIVVLFAWCAGCRSDVPSADEEPPKSETSVQNPVESAAVLDRVLARTLAIQSEVAKVLESAGENPDATITRLRKMEESTRLERVRLRREGRAVMRGMTPAERTAFSTRAQEQQRRQGAALNRSVKTVVDLEKRRVIMGIVRLLVR